MAAYIPNENSLEPSDFTNTVAPFVLWNRLEGRQESLEFDHSIRTDVFDPLWFLTRQWQFGELKADDAGSPIVATVSYSERKITHYLSKEVEEDGSTSEEWVNVSNEDGEDFSVPLEVYIESLPIQFTIKQKAAMGRYFFKLIEQSGTTADIPTIKDGFLTHDSFKFKSDFSVDGTNYQENLADTKLTANKKALQLLRLYENRLPDGIMVYNDIKSDSTDFEDMLTGYGVDSAIITSLKDDFRNWLEDTFELASANTWKGETMEYDSALALRSSDNQVDILDVQNIANGEFDWYAVDKNFKNVTEPDTSEQSSYTTKVVSSIPTPAAFEGMPADRWWEMEDAKIDYANIDAEGSEAVKLAISEFALVYSNDWFVCPLKIENEGYARVNAVKVKDVFGQYTIIEKSAHEGVRELLSDPVSPDNPWLGWKFFKQDTSSYTTPDLDDYNERKAHYGKGEIFLPGCLPFRQQSEILEQVDFIRDEIDNRVWAVEKRIFDPARGSIDGEIWSGIFTNYIKNHLIDEILSNVQSVPLSYKLQTNIPENWIPFSPVKRSTSEREYSLLRSKLLRTFTEPNMPIRPNSMLLSPGIDQNTSAQAYPMFINDNLISKAGLIVEDRNQRTRWYNGKTLVWRGRSQ